MVDVPLISEILYILAVKTAQTVYKISGYALNHDENNSTGIFRIYFLYPLLFQNNSNYGKLSFYFSATFSLLGWAAYDSNPNSFNSFF